MAVELRGFMGVYHLPSAYSPMCFVMRGNLVSPCTAMVVSNVSSLRVYVVASSVTLLVRDPLEFRRPRLQAIT